jgi:hypothetical protein
MADNPCKIPPKCHTTLAEARKTAKICRQRNIEQCEEHEYASYCNYKKPSKFSGLRKTCKWLKRNPNISTTDDVTPEDIQIRQTELIRKDPKFIEKFINANVCENHSKATLDVRDILYFMEKYKGDKDHVIYTPKCKRNYDYSDSDFSVDWNAKEENYKGSLQFPNGFRKRLEHYKNTLGGKNPWVAILMTIHSDMSHEYHANILFYYPKRGTVERIEASGYRFPYFDQVEFDNRLHRAFKRWKLKYIPTIDILPRQGPASIAVVEEQNIEGEDITGDPSGFCQTWSYFVLDQRYQHPNEEIKDLFLRVIDKVINTNHTFLEVVRSFHGVVQKASSKIFKKIGFMGEEVTDEDEYEELDDYFYDNFLSIAEQYDLC